MANTRGNTTGNAPLPHLKPHAAAIDVGSEQFFVSVGPGHVESFSTFTGDLYRLRDYLKAEQIESVAIDAAGVYWLVLFEVLEEAGFEVIVINGGYAKGVPGRKSDVLDCQWYQQLFSYGLLRPCFVPEDKVRQLRSLVRLRKDHIRSGASYVQQMQKALDLMNIKLHEVISQIQGASGLRVMKAILAGERDPERLAALCDKQILSRKRERVLASLHGHYRSEHLTALKEAIVCWEFFNERIVGLDKQIEATLEEMTRDLDPPQQMTPAKPIRHHKPQIAQLHEKMLTLTGGADVAAMAGLTDLSLLELIAEVGTDMTKWADEKKFSAWCCTAPGLWSSGKGRRHKRRRGRHRVGQIFRECAQALARSKYLALGGFYRRIAARRGAKVAIVATARKLAVLFYRMMRYGWAYVELGLEQYEQQQRERQVRSLHRRAKQLGLTLVPAC